MHINDLLADHSSVLAAIYKAKHNKVDGKINPWPKMKESKSYVLLDNEVNAVSIPVRVVHGPKRSQSKISEAGYVYSSVEEKRKK
jgi:hypothetical protein